MESIDLPRRRLLAGGVAAGSLFLPLPWAWVWAQSEGAVRLLRLPKVALIVGNGSYRKAPALRNPANDARAIAEVLAAAQFEVTTKIDLERAELLAVIQAHAQALAKRKCVGLFYFAGHGVQLAWHNYLMPVEASIEKMDDVPKAGVDLGVLVDGLKQASNPMNVIVLDACRENPFQADFREGQKGLSQMDAPPATFLAYATSPGNVASDGDGMNGLYTEHLLREVRVPEAKIEDVFKRVRLGVRRRTNGAQIPWESTSLEEDFYFLPPGQLKTLSEAELEKDFSEQLALWEAVRDSSEPEPLMGYLSRYPSGDYSELAQVQLDRVLATKGEKRVAAAPTDGNPFTKGTARMDTVYRVGDTYTYRKLNLETRAVEGKFTTTITDVSDTRVVFDRGLVTDLLGNTLRTTDGRRFTDNQNVPVAFEVGRQWTTRYRVDNPKGSSVFVELGYRVESREEVTVPAGRFNAYLVEGRGTYTRPAGGTVEVLFRTWWDPQQVRRPIAREELRRLLPAGKTADSTRQGRRHARVEREAKGRIIASERQELVAYSQS